MGEIVADRRSGAPVEGRLRSGARAWYDSLSPLRIRSVRIYLTGQVISLIGIWMQQTAQSWVVWELSHSGTALGIAAMLAFLPTFFLGPWMGVFADRWDRRKVLVATQTSAMILAFRGSQIRRTSTGRPLQEFREGLAFLRKETRAQDLLAFSVMVTFFGISSIIILPAVVSLVLGGGADMLGFLLASSGAGALVGALVLTPLAQRARRWPPSY